MAAIAANDEDYVDQTATDEYAIHQYKDYVGAAGTVNVLWNGQSDLAPSASIVKLQVYNYDTPAWEDIDSDNATAADTDFDLSGAVDTTDRISPQGTMTFRVYQLAQ